MSRVRDDLTNRDYLKAIMLLVDGLVGERMQEIVDGDYDEDAQQRLNTLLSRRLAAQGILRGFDEVFEEFRDTMLPEDCRAEAEMIRYRKDAESSKPDGN